MATTTTAGRQDETPAQRGTRMAQKHACRPSVIDPTRTQLHPWDYAERMADESDRAYWAAYAAESKRIDPDRVNVRPPATTTG